MGLGRGGRCYKEWVFDSDCGSDFDSDFFFDCDEVGSPSVSLRVGR